MASLSHPQFFSSLISIKKKTFPISPHPNSSLTFKNSRISSSKADSSPNFQGNSPESQSHEQDPVKLAFSKAKAYKNSIQSGIQTPSIVQSPLEKPDDDVSGKNDDSSISDEVKDGDVEKEVPLAVKLALEKGNEYKKNKILAESEGVVSKIVQDSGVNIDEKNGKIDGVKSDKDDGGEKEIPLAVKLALEKAKEYKKSKIIAESEGVVSKIVQDSGVEIDEKNDGVKSDKDDGGEKEIPLSVKLAMEKAKEYKKNQGEILASELQGGNDKSFGDKRSTKNSGKKEELTISSTDFMGLNFADKKSGRGLPAGLVPLSDPFPEGELPEVEILVGDTSKFGDTKAAPKASPTKENDSDLYKPKVTTWGVFPRPNNISTTYGGGRNIRPGEELETAEERAAKEARTRQLLAAYKSKKGLNIDSKLKSECEKALNDGDSLMDLGKLKEALPFYEKVMEKLAFQNELYGLAALQWSICQDSLSRPNEARTMYEKLQSHPSPQVSKKARQFSFGFQAMEMMKVTSLNRSPRSTGYQNYFDAFVQDKTNYPMKEAEVDEGGLNQALPYVIFLVSPIFMVLLIAASRSQ